MARLLSLFMILALVVTQGTSMAQALCRHESAAAHIAARESRDARIAAVSIGEEAAAASASKKGSQSSDGASHWPADALPPRVEAPVAPAGEAIRVRPARASALPSANIPPPLKPPSA